MRTYAPADTPAVLERLLEEPSLARGVVHHEVIPAREARHASMPAWLDERIGAGVSPSYVEVMIERSADAASSPNSVT
jgi:hypothetical protein